MSIYAWGLTKKGQAGNDQDNGKVIVPSKINVNKSYGNIVDLSAGGLYTAAITDKNFLISFGCGKYGRLGSGSEDDQYLPFASTIKGDTLQTISCGLWHGATLHKDGKVSVWGYKKACGGTEHSLVPKVVLGLNQCVGISCGNNYTLVWTSEGKAYSWGSNLHGVLGHGNKEQADKPVLIEGLSHVKVVHMNAGFAHCGAVTEDGNVFMWGRSKFGALGLGDREKHDFLLPQHVPGLSNIKMISCNVGENHGHTLALSNDGIVYSTGDGYKGKLGFGNQNSIFTFQDIPLKSFLGDAIKQVSAGGIHSSALSEEGHVFTWGCGSDGRLGHPEAKGHRYLFCTNFPQIVKTFKYQVRVVSSSYYHMVALSEN